MEEVKNNPSIDDYNVQKIQTFIFNKNRLNNIFKDINKDILKIIDENEEESMDESEYTISGKFYFLAYNYFDKYEEDWIYNIDLVKSGDCDCSRIVLFSITKYKGYSEGYGIYLDNIISFISKVNVLDAKKCSNCFRMLDNGKLYCSECIDKCIIMSIEDICAICQDENHLLGFYVYGDKCKHIFHKCCMEKCQNKCPLCNSKQRFYQI